MGPIVEGLVARIVLGGDTRASTSRDRVVTCLSVWGGWYCSVSDLT